MNIKQFWLFLLNVGIDFQKENAKKNTKKNEKTIKKKTKKG